LLGILHSSLLSLGLQCCDDFTDHLDVILLRLAVTEGLVFQALGIMLWIDTLLSTLLQLPQGLSHLGRHDCTELVGLPVHVGHVRVHSVL